MIHRVGVIQYARQILILNFNHARGLDVVTQIVFGICFVMEAVDMYVKHWRTQYGNCCVGCHTSVPHLMTFKQ